MSERRVVGHVDGSPVYAAPSVSVSNTRMWRDADGVTHVKGTVSGLRVPDYDLRFPPPAKPWSVNEVPSSVRARINQTHTKQAWRDTTIMLAKSGFRHEGKPFPPCNVKVWIPFPTYRRRDPHNYVGTVVKAIVDGLVRAGLWPDDNPEWVTVMEPVTYKGTNVVIALYKREDG